VTVISETLKYRIKAAGARVGKTGAVRRVLPLLGVRPARPAAMEFHGVPVPGDVVVYYGDGADKIYQLVQWLPVLETLHRRKRVLVVCRRIDAYRALAPLTDLPRIFIRRFTDLVDLYESNDYGMVLYVNNGQSNFQSLEHPWPVHVHVNHGESDKISMVSNKAKAYDRVFVAGPAAIERHRARLLDFDLDRLVVTGRPQLDEVFVPELLPVPGRTTVMYAPTWEGENEVNNYTSVEPYGPAIAAALLALPGVRLVYKPHPRVLDSTTPSIVAAHGEIVRLVEAAADGGHAFLPGGNILAMFDAVDALVTDISSVGLDFLYLRPEQPIVLTDRRNNAAKLEQDSPLARACGVVNGANAAAVGERLREWIFGDGRTAERARMREFYFGGLRRGESTESFEKEIDRLIAERRQQLRQPREHGPATQQDPTTQQDPATQQDRTTQFSPAAS